MGTLAALAAAIVALLAMAALGALIGAVFLRAACWLYNKLAGGPKTPASVPNPGFHRAMLIAFLVWLVTLGVRLIITLTSVTGLSAESQRSAALLGVLVSVPIGYLAMSGILTAMLPTTFPRALLVALLYWLIVIVVIGTVIAIAFGVGILGFGK